MDTNKVIEWTLMFLNLHGLRPRCSMTFLFLIQGTGNHHFYFKLFGSDIVLCLFSDDRMIVLGKPLAKSKHAVSESTYVDLHFFIMD